MRAADLVNGTSPPTARTRLWVTDLTYVPTWSGMAYVCFIVDAFSRVIVGWRVAIAHAHRDGPRRAGDGPLARGGRRLVGLVAHSDAGSQFTRVRYTERLAEIGARPSIGTVADSYDNALAETTNGLYKTELIYGPDTDGWDDVDELELATLAWVHWFNTERLHGHCGHVPPAEFEAAFYAAQQATPPGLESNSPSLHQTQGDSKRWDTVVIGELQTAVCGNQFGLTFPVFVHYGIELWVLRGRWSDRSRLGRARYRDERYCG